MLPVLALMRLFAQPPVSQSYRDDFRRLGRARAHDDIACGQEAQSCERQA